MKLSDLEKILRIKFHNIGLLNEALTHRSYLNENKKIKRSNERLEFLGDSVLSLVASTEIFTKFPDHPEGKLTNLRSTLVRTETLAKIARDLDLGNFLFLSRGEEKEGGRDNQSLLADTFEAVLGAIYLDQGLEVAKQFLEKYLFPKIEPIAAGGEKYDYKSQLQEVVQQKNKITPVYKVLKEEGPDHNKTFTVEVLAGNNSLAEGSGRSKQEAEQSAAKTALEQIK